MVRGRSMRDRSNHLGGGLTSGGARPLHLTRSQHTQEKNRCQDQCPAGRIAPVDRRPHGHQSQQQPQDQTDHPKTPANLLKRPIDARYV